jgi:integrase
LRFKTMAGRSPQHIKLTFALLRRVIRYGHKRGLCELLGFQIELPRVNNETTEDLTPEQLVALLKACDDDYDIQSANMVRLALFTGMRRGELCKLKWDHVDFQKRFIKIVDPKGGRDEVIPMNEASQAVLESHPRKSDYVFPGRGGKQRTEARRGPNRIKKAAGLPENFRPLHGLRHCFASRLASSGQCDLFTLSKLLGHKSTDMTRRYAHLRDDSLRRASELAGVIEYKTATESTTETATESEVTHEDIGIKANSK